MNRLAMDGLCHPMISSPGKTASGIAPDQVFWLQLTNKCNLACVHCYAGSNWDDPIEHAGIEAAEYWRRVLSLGRSMERSCLVLTGGEPTLHPMLPDILKMGAHMGYRTRRVLTNGTMRTPALEKAFIEQRVELSVSVYSMDRKVNGRITGRSDSLEKTLGTLRWAVKNNIPVLASIVRITQSDSEIEELLAWLSDNGIENYCLDDVRAIGRGACASPEKSGDSRNAACLCSCEALGVDVSGTVRKCIY